MSHEIPLSNLEAIIVFVLFGLAGYVWGLRDGRRKP